MIFALIAILAALDTPSAYQLVDVSQIAVTGDREAAVGENVKGEHMARFFEWLAESRWIMQDCGAEIPTALADWTPPAPHAILAPEAAIAAYNAANAANATNRARWIYSSGINDDYLLCFSREYNDSISSETVAEITAAAVAQFEYDYYYQETGNATMPVIASGSNITAAAVNQMNRRSNYDSYRWTTIGAESLWSYKDNSYATTTRGGGGATTYEDDIAIPSSFNEWAGWQDPSHLCLEIDDLQNGRLKFPHIFKASSPLELLTTEYISDSSNMQNLTHVYGGNIVGRNGIRIYSRSIVFFVCCWRVNYNTPLDAKMNVKVFAKQFTLGGSETIGDILDGALSRTPAPTGKQYDMYAVAILCARHGAVRFTPNAYY